MNWKIPVLASYAYLKQGNVFIEGLRNASEYFDIIIDSGAFTAYKLNKVITLDEYCNFLDNINLPTKYYFTLDEIGNSKKTLANYNELKSRGYKPIPIFTRGDNIKLFHQYYKDTEFVGIGGIAGTEKNSGYLKYLMDEEGLKEFNCHWLGFWDRDFLFHYKPTSCDSSAWQHFSMFGRVYLYVNRTFESFTRKDYQRNSKVFTFCEKYGINYNELADNDSWRNIVAIKGWIPPPKIISALSFLLFARDCKRYLGTDVFVVLARIDHVELLVYCAKQFEKFLTL